MLAKTRFHPDSVFAHLVTSDTPIQSLVIPCRSVKKPVVDSFGNHVYALLLEYLIYFFFAWVQLETSQAEMTTTCWVRLRLILSIEFWILILEKMNSCLRIIIVSCRWVKSILFFCPLSFSLVVVSPLSSFGRRELPPPPRNCQLYAPGDVDLKGYAIPVCRAGCSDQWRLWKWLLTIQGCLWDCQCPVGSITSSRPLNTCSRLRPIPCHWT